MTKIMRGQPIADKVLEGCASDVAKLRDQETVPGLAFVLVGDDPASHIYVNLKRKACEKLGITSHVCKLPAATPTEAIKKEVKKLNQDPQWSGILVQLPLPEGVDTLSVISSIAPAKDVDGLHPLNQGLLACGMTNQPVACTPKGCMRLIRDAGVDPKGKLATVVGRSRIVGRPMSLLLQRAGATVTVAHTGTKDLAAVCLTADILVVAAGHKHLVDGKCVKEGAIVLDVGINKTNGRMTGDVDTNSVDGTAAIVTPVPGGVGPMTVAMLMRNTVDVAMRQFAMAKR